MNLLVTLLLLLIQVDSSTFIEPDSPLTIRLNGETILAYESAGGEVITVTARAIDEIDTVLEILTPDMARLAYNDDHDTTSENLALTDSALEQITLEEAGIYTIRVNSFNGVSEGEVEVTLSQVARTAGDTVMITLTPSSRYFHTFSAQAGDIVTITARDSRSLLDPVLILRRDSGEEISRNDDHQSDDLSLNIFDSRIQTLTIDVDGEYTIELREFMGRAGSIELSIQNDRR